MKKLLPLLLALFAAPAWADEASDQYEGCLTAVYVDPESARVAAENWEKAGGGAPARHCIAFAALKAGDAKGAARMFEDLADEVTRGVGLSSAMGDTPESRAALSADLLAQGANARVVAGEPVAAEALLNRAIDGAAIVRPGWYVDRARARLMAGKAADALTDLDEAAKLNEDATDLDLYRAVALKDLKRYLDALKAAEDAVRRDPGNEVAWGERAAIAALAGDMAKAKREWQAILDRFPGTDAAKAAAENLKGAPAASSDPAPNAPHP